MDGCIELTGGVPEKVKNLHDLLKPEDNGKTADRLFFDLVRASQLGNIILVQAPHHVHKGDKHNKLRLAEAAQLGLEVKYVYRVTQVANLGEGRQIIRVKNCSGPKGINWIGAWHPEDTRWANVGDSIRRELDAGNAPKVIICTYSYARTFNQISLNFCIFQQKPFMMVVFGWPMGKSR